MFSETAELYDLIYGQFKDYAKESAAIAELLRSLHPEAVRVLDVACGTGEHARHLREYGYEVDGLDLEPEFVRIAKGKNPEGDFVCADMRDFSLPGRYDAVLCLFSSIGYLRDLDGVRRALHRFVDHLTRDGVVVVEPWFEPSQWRPGTVHAHLAESEQLKVCRMSHSTVRDAVSVLEFHYLIGGVGGVEHRHETHELGLFTSEEMTRAFGDAGLVVEYDPEGPVGRGLYVARQEGR